jgi:hypothetical protein
MDELFYSSGQIGSELNVSPARVRALCLHGLITAEQTEGGQWRVPARELARLKRDGVPPLPRPLPDADAAPARNGRPPYGHPALLAERSSRVVSAAEELAVMESRLKQRRLERDLSEEEDWFQQRDEQKTQRAAEQREIEQRRQAEAEAERKRHDRDNRWLRYAMNGIPGEVRGEVEAQMHEQVLAALDHVRLTEPEDVVQRLVDAAFHKVLQPWRRRKEVARAIEDARRSLPSQMIGYSWKPTTWEAQARAAAAKALENVRPDASYQEMCSVAHAAVQPVMVSFRAHEAAVADQELRQRVIQSTSWPRELTEHGRELASKAISDAIAKLPQGTPCLKLEAARDEALKPFHKAIAEAHAEQRAQQEAQARRQQDLANRETVLRCTSSKFPYDLPKEEREAALVAVRKALDQVPAGTDMNRLEAARDKALQPFLEAHARRKRTAPLIEAGLREVLPSIRKLEADWAFDKSAVAIDAELQPLIRKRLEGEISGSESVEEIAKRVRRLVQQVLDIR